MDIYQHFRSEERPYIEKMMEWIRMVDQRTSPKLTDFLDPRQARILQTLVNRFPDLQVHFFGGYEGSERVRAIIAQEFIPVSEEDFQVSLLLIESRSNFQVLEHRDYLGALLNLGVIRDKFGDLLVHKDRAYLLVHREMLDFVRTHLHSVGKVPVLTSQLLLSELMLPEKVMETKKIIVSSKRLDTILSEVLPISRTKALPLIKSGKVKVNWRIIDTPSFELGEGDVVSVRGFGRFQLVEESGTTKKGNYLFTIGFEKEAVK